MTEDTFLAPDDSWREIAGMQRNRHVYHCGKIYHKMQPEGRVLGMRIQEHNTNYVGVIHGGMIMTFADFALASAGMRSKNDNITTVQFNCQFVAGAKQGTWIEARMNNELKRSLGFHEGKITADGKVLLIFSGITKLLSAPIPDEVKV